MQRGVSARTAYSGIGVRNTQDTVYPQAVRGSTLTTQRATCTVYTTCSGIYYMCTPTGSILHSTYIMLCAGAHLLDTCAMHVHIAYYATRWYILGVLSTQ